MSTWDIVPAAGVVLSNRNMWIMWADLLDLALCIVAFFVGAFLLAIIGVVGMFVMAAAQLIQEEWNKVEDDIYGEAENRQSRQNSKQSK